LFGNVLNFCHVASNQRAQSSTHPARSAQAWCFCFGLLR
jgi:hypothetical protein